ncbi:hypothetical protein X975_08346, partial [Stegodyphus mimosarum]
MLDIFKLKAVFFHALVQRELELDLMSEVLMMKDV